MMTITIAAITIGIAVDNSIHYIYRVKKEMIDKKSLIIAIKECHNTVGNAVLTTSITIAFGFSILLLSNFLPTNLFRNFYKYSYDCCNVRDYDYIAEIINIIQN